MQLQEKMDELESMGVLARPEDLDITVEHVSPSFLVKNLVDLMELPVILSLYLPKPAHVTMFYMLYLNGNILLKQT